MNNHNHKVGFTLLELLVVIGIMAILITVGTVSYSTVQKKARDAKRKTDLKDIQNAFEQYYSICNLQYGVSGAGSVDLTAGTTLTCTVPDPDVDLITYTADPLGGNYHCDNCDPDSYLVCPPDLDPGPAVKYLETENCTDISPTCCLRNQQ